MGYSKSSVIDDITDSARSGKSANGQQLALSLSSHPVYLSTANQTNDSKFTYRMKHHPKQQNDKWGKTEFDKLDNPNHELFISNEVGMSLHEKTIIQRRFINAQGWIKQYIALWSQRATLMIQV